MSNTHTLKPIIKLNAILLGILFSSPSVFAAEIPTFEGDAIVVTANRQPQKLEHVLQPTQVITAKTIRQSGQTNLLEVLQNQAGISFTQNGGTGSAASLFLRGTNGGHTLVLIDGLRISSATTGKTAIEHIPLDQVDRIEIVNGPLSGLYGSDALGGVIQIFTKQAKAGEAVQPNVNVGFGSDNTYKASAGVRGQVDKTQYSLQIGTLRTGGFSATNPKIDSPFFKSYNPDNDYYENQNVSFKLKHHINENHQIGFSAFYTKAKTDYDNNPTGTAQSQQTLSSYALNSQHQLNSVWQAVFQLAQTEDEYRDYQNGRQSNGYFKTIQNQFSWQNNFKLDPYQLLTVGLDYNEQKITSDVNFTQKKRDTKGLFAMYQLNVNAHHLQVNLRQEDNSQYGTHTAGNLTYAFDVTPQSQAHFGFGHAFKNPTFNDLYYPSSPYYRANPDLKPEKMDSYELGAKYQGENTRLQLTYFNWKIKDLITYQNDPVTYVGTMANIDEAKNEGLTLNLDTKLTKDTQLKANLTVQDPKDAKTGRRLARRAQQTANFVLQHRYSDKFSAQAEIFLSGARYDDAYETANKRLGGYGLVNLSAQYALQKELNLKVNFSNIFDKQYEIAYGYNTPGSQIFIGLEYAPK